MDLTRLLLRFPPEVVLDVFSYLSNGDIENLAAGLESSTKNHQYDALIGLAYNLLYLKSLVVDSTKLYNDKDKKQELNYIDIYKLSQVMSCDTTSLQDQAIIKTCPKSLTFCFTRELMDPKLFMEEVNTFSDILCSLVSDLKGITESTTHSYLNMINSFSLLISSGRDQSSTELPTAVGVLILRLLTHLADPETNMRPALLLKLTTLDVHNSDLGNFLHIGWGKLLKRFTNLLVLKLNDNLIGDLIEEFEWPSHLRTLTIANNRIESPDFLKKLPHTLELLSLGRNYFRKIGFNSSFFALSRFPNLRSLNLERSFNLRDINANIFQDIGTNGQFETLVLYNCSLSSQCWQSLEEASIQENFTVLSGTDHTF